MAIAPAAAGGQDTRIQGTTAVPHQPAPPETNPSPPKDLSSLNVDRYESADKLRADLREYVAGAEARAGFSSSAEVAGARALAQQKLKEFDDVVAKREAPLRQAKEQEAQAKAIFDIDKLNPAERASFARLNEVHESLRGRPIDVSTPSTARWAQQMLQHGTPDDPAFYALLDKASTETRAAYQKHLGREPTQEELGRWMPFSASMASNDKTWAKRTEALQDPAFLRQAASEIAFQKQMGSWFAQAAEARAKGVEPPPVPQASFARVNIKI